MQYHFKTEPSKEYDTKERCSIIEILNNPEYQDVSIAQARVKQGVTTAIHALSNTDEIYYILSGQGMATMDDQQYKLVKGDALLIPKGKHQSIENIGEEDLVFLCVCTPRFHQSNYVNKE